MVIVKQGLKGKNPEAKVTYGNHVVTKTTANANFPDIATVRDAMGTTAGKLDDAIKDPLSTAKSIQEKVTAFNLKMKAVVAHVQTVVNDFPDEVAEAKVESAGLETTKKTKVNIADFSATQGMEEKSLKVRKYRGKDKGVIFHFQMCTDPTVEENWKDAKISKRATVTVRNLVSGTRYYFRVAIIRGDVQEDYSEFISIIVD